MKILSIKQNLYSYDSCLKDYLDLTYWVYWGDISMFRRWCRIFNISPFEF